MSKKIFNSIWIVALAVFLASLLFIMGMSYSYFSDVQEAQLRIETELAAKGTAMGGTDYLEGLGQKNYRITWIDSDGTVLYDSQADSAGMENHLEREEVRQALETGHGESSRYSKTLSEELLYCAELLPDGTVIRRALNGTHAAARLCAAYRHRCGACTCAELLACLPPVQKDNRAYKRP